MVALHCIQRDYGDGTYNMHIVFARFVFLSIKINEGIPGVLWTEIQMLFNHLLKERETLSQSMFAHEQ